MTPRSWSEIGIEAREPVRARRELRVFERPVELVWIPERARRANVPGADRPSFVPDRGARIRSEEACWHADELVVTPNRWPFYARQALLWRRHGFARELDEGMLVAALRLARELGATLMHNTVGAAASVPMGHLHLVETDADFLRSCCGAVLHRDAQCEVLRPAADVPLSWIAVRCRDAARAARIGAGLLARRSTPAANLIAHEELLVVVPRRVETPRPHFAYALGGAELAGRWVFQEETEFAGCDAARLEAALLAACVPWSEAEARGLGAVLEDVLGA